MRAWLGYAAAGAVLTLVVAAVAVVVAGSEAATAVAVAAVLAYLLQLAAFAVLVVVRGRSDLFMLGWVAGMGLRFAAVGAVAWWVTRTAALPAAPLLVSLVAFMFVLVLLEPVFLRRGLRAR